MIYVLLALYLISGFIIWSLGLKAEGGSKGYLLRLAEDYGHPYLMFFTAWLAVVIFWPFFIIRGIMSKDE